MNSQESSARYSGCLMINFHHFHNFHTNITICSSSSTPSDLLVLLPGSRLQKRCAAMSLGALWAYRGNFMLSTLLQIGCQMDNRCENTEVDTASEFTAKESNPITTSFLISHHKQWKVSRSVSVQSGDIKMKFTAAQHKSLYCLRRYWISEGYKVVTRRRELPRQVG